MAIALSTYTEFNEVAAADTKKLLVMANLRAPQMLMTGDNERAPVSVSAVIDRSGSMQGGKMELTKATLRFVINNLTARDEFGIVSYASDVTENVKLQKMDAAGRKRALQAVRMLNADGCTNLSGGLFGGINQLRGLPVRDSVRDSSNFAERVGQTIFLNIGNECSGTEADVLSCPWTVFVRLPSDSPFTVADFIERVEYKVNADGISQVLTVAQAPFELSRPAGETSEVTVTIHLKAQFGGSVHTFAHIPNFASPLTYSTVPIHTMCSGPMIVTTPPSCAESSPSERNDVCALWLFTDGLANEGITDRTDLVRRTQIQLQEMSPACSIFTFGFGEDHDAQMLREIADAAKGMYYFVESDTSIPEAFADCLGGLVSVVARNIKLTVTAEDGVIIHQAFTKYEREVNSQQSWIKIPDLYSEEERDIILEIGVSPVNPARPEPEPVVHFHIEYDNTLSNQHDDATAPALLARPEEARPCRAHPELDKQRNRVMCRDVIDECKRLADQGELSAARLRIEAAMQAIRNSESATDPFCIGLIDDLKDCLVSLENEAQYRSRGAHYMSNAISCHTYQRSCGMKQKYSNFSSRAMVQRYRDQQDDEYLC